MQKLHKRPFIWFIVGWKIVDKIQLKETVVVDTFFVLIIYETSFLIII